MREWQGGGSGCVPVGAVRSRIPEFVWTCDAAFVFFKHVSVLASCCAGDVFFCISLCTRGGRRFLFTVEMVLTTEQRPDHYFVFGVFIDFPGYVPLYL